MEYLFVGLLQDVRLGVKVLFCSTESTSYFLCDLWHIIWCLQSYFFICTMRDYCINHEEWLWLSSELIFMKPMAQFLTHRYLVINMRHFCYYLTWGERNWWRSVTCWPCFSSILGSCRASVTKGWMAPIVKSSEVLQNGVLCWDLCFMGSWRRGRGERKPSWVSDLASSASQCVFKAMALV